MSKEIPFCSCDCEEWISNFGRMKTDTIFNFCPFCGKRIHSVLHISDGVEKVNIQYPTGDQFLINLGK
jgi:hypothetical protein